MGEPMRDCTRALRTFWLTLITTVLLSGSLTAPSRAAQRWDVTVALRIVPETPGPVSLRLALPIETERQSLARLSVAARGLTEKIASDDPHPNVVLKGRLRRARRAAVTFSVETSEASTPVPPVAPIDIPTPELLPFLTPEPLFQSRSILVRDFLETHVAPILRGADVDVMRAILEATRQRLEHIRDGKSLALDVIRRGHGKRIGIERTFTTFLRCARIPARFVEGINLKGSTRRKRVFWTEVWTAGRWWPVSASEGWVGQLPTHYLALARDGTRVVKIIEGNAQAAYSIQARRAEETR